MDLEYEGAAYGRARARVAARCGFCTHLAIYLSVNVVLCSINLLTNPHHMWFYWPLLAWAIGLAAHAVQVFALDGRIGRAWEERNVNELMRSDEGR